MKKTLNTKTQSSLNGFISAAITMAFITLCFISISACVAQDTLRQPHDSSCLIMVPDEIDDSFWDTETIHLKGIDMQTLPDSITIPLVDSLHGYCMPYPGGCVFSKFKYRGRHAHKGVDIPLHVGDEIYAAFDGVVRVVMPTKKTGGYGNLVVIRHYNGIETYYGHLKKCLVNAGDTISAGTLIGYGGSTGRSTGPHLHFETRYMGKAFDPERIFDFKNDTLRCQEFSLKKHYLSCHSHYGMTDQQSLTAFTNPPRISPAPIYYKVQRGDSLSRIAKRKGTTVRNICKLNGINENNYIRVGQRLRIK